MRHHNTTGESGQYLLNLEEKAKRLEDTVLQIFQREKRPLNWSEVFEFVPDSVECSLKRSITNLKTEGKLIKTTDKRTTKYGRPAFLYQLAA